MGYAVQFHIKPGRQTTFGEHSGDGFYLKTLEEHYRMHVVFCKKTRAKRLADTIFFKHKNITQPTITPADTIVNTFTKLQDAIQGIHHDKMMPTWKLYTASTALFSLLRPTAKQSNASNLQGRNASNLQGRNNKLHLPRKFQGCSLTPHHQRSMTLCPDGLLRCPGNKLSSHNPGRPSLNRQSMLASLLRRGYEHDAFNHKQQPMTRSPNELLARDGKQLAPSSIKKPANSSNTVN